MPQVFHPSSNTFSKASIVGAIIIITGAVLYLAGYLRSSFVTQVNVPIEQPIPFSHKNHVAGRGIQCTYCHATVTKSAFADLPPTHTCMTCHSQIFVNSPMLQPVRDSFQNNTPILWNRVYDLQDFAYFRHDIHVNKGVGCESCHGRVDQMPTLWKATPMNMGWCLGCHEHTERYLRPQSEIMTMGYQNPPDDDWKLWADYHIQPVSYLTDCYTCHR
jgi:hypothetical protein